MTDSFDRFQRFGSLLLRRQPYLKQQESSSPRNRFLTKIVTLTQEARQRQLVLPGGQRGDRLLTRLGEAGGQLGLPEL